MFEIKVLTYALKKLNKLVKSNKNLKTSINKTLEKLSDNPFDTSLRTHKVISKRFGDKYSSSISGDLRVIWNFNSITKEISIIEIQDIGGHSGNRGVY
jgi:mRNA-degrading endonuclease YafQ of YafQ-DinJ toxin-antitoxin module